MRGECIIAKARNLLLIVIPWSLAAIILYLNLNGLTMGYEGWFQTIFGILIVTPFRWESFLNFLGEKVGRVPSLRVRLNDLESHAAALKYLEDKVRDEQLSLQENGRPDQKTKKAQYRVNLRKMKTILGYVSADIDDVSRHFQQYREIVERQE